MPLESWLDYGKFWLPAELRRFARTSVFFSEIEIEGKREKIIFKKNIILIM